jgi:multiple antibiotic resistance protein
MCLYGLFLGLSFVFLGESLLKALGVSIPAFRMGGGVLLGVTAWGLLYSDNKPSENVPFSESTMRFDISLCPLAFPMFIGPATLTTLVSLILEAKAVSIFEASLVVIALLLLIALTYVLTLLGSGIVKILGRNGAIILEKVGGILLVAISIEMIAGGARIFFKTPSQPVVQVENVSR